MIRRHIYISNELEWKIKQAAADESAKQGRTVSVSEWVRDKLRKAVK